MVEVRGTTLKTGGQSKSLYCEYWASSLSDTHTIFSHFVSKMLSCRLLSSMYEKEKKKKKKNFGGGLIRGGEESD